MIEVIQLKGTEPRLYKHVAPLVMDPKVIHYNQGYPFKTSPNYIWFLAFSSPRKISGFFPVEHRGGQWIINNYYVAPTGKEQETFQALLEAVKTFAADQQEVTAIVQTPHKDYFTAYAFKPVKEWKAYLKMRLNEQTEHQEECI